MKVTAFYVLEEKLLGYACQPVDREVHLRFAQRAGEKAFVVRTDVSVEECQIQFQRQAREPWLTIKEAQFFHRLVKKIEEGNVTGGGLLYNQIFREITELELPLAFPNAKGLFSYFLELCIHLEEEGIAESGIAYFKQNIIPATYEDSNEE